MLNGSFPDFLQMNKMCEWSLLRKDSFGSIIAYIWTQISGPTVSLSSYEEPVVSFLAPNEGTMEFQLEVYDNEGASGSDIVSILVLGGGMSVSEIQETSDPGSGNDCYPSPYNGQVVTVTGIVTAVSPGSNPNFYFEDPNADIFAGVYVYDKDTSPMFEMDKSNKQFFKTNSNNTIVNLLSCNTNNFDKVSNRFKVGDDVKIIESRPFSKLKKWEVINK